MARDQLLVCRDHRPARFENGLNPLLRRFNASHDFDDKLHVAGQNIVDILGPLNIAVDPGSALALNVAVEYLREFKARQFSFGQDACHGFANGAESKDCDPA